MSKVINDIRDSSDPDIRGSYDAMIRAGKSAIDLAISTNTGIVICVEGTIVHISAEELIKKYRVSSAI
jgi:hypothetical protein